jgi:SAM-dependent methyltransferase
MTANLIDSIDPGRQVGPEVRKTLRMRIENGFFAQFFSGSNILDIGFRGDNPANQPIVPWAIGVDTGYPGYDGTTLPFEDRSQDTVHSSHCLEHIPNPREALAEWFRVLRIGGFLVLTVPHQQLYERKPVPTSRWGGNEHLRFYTVASCTSEIEEALPVGEFRFRLVRDNDAGFDYNKSPTEYPNGCYEIEVVIQRIARPDYADLLRLSPEARASIETYRVLIESLLRHQAEGLAMDRAALEQFGLVCPIPPYSVVREMFPDPPDSTLRALIWPLVDASVVDAEWYCRKHVDVGGGVQAGTFTAAQHYRHSGYFECKLPSPEIGLYG